MTPAKLTTAFGRGDTGEGKTWIVRADDPAHGPLAGHGLAVGTNAPDEKTFIAEVAAIITDKIGTVETTEWSELLPRVLQNVVEIVCSYRGYKTMTRQYTQRVAGDHYEMANAAGTPTLVAVKKEPAA